MTGDLHLSGPISLALRGSTTARDTTWIATVTDVSPGGESTQLTAGWLLASRRALDRRRSVAARNGDLVAPFHPFTRASVQSVEPGHTDTLNVEIFNTDAVIKRGHRLRLAISSGDVPHLLQPAPALANSVGSVNTVHYGPRQASFLTVPVVRAGADRIAIRRVARRLSRSRALAVGLACPDREFDCQVRVVIGKGRRTLGRRTVLVRAGTARTVKVRLSKRRLRRLRRSARLRTTAALLDETGVASTTTRTAKVRIRRR